MLDTTQELITMATWSPPLIFCLFNIIVIFLVISSNDSSNTASRFSEDTPVTYSEDNVIILTEGDEEETAVVETSCSLEETEGVEVDGNDIREEEDGDEEEENELLRRRIEAFIDKVNRVWRAEKLAEIAKPSYIDCR